MSILKKTEVRTFDKCIIIININKWVIILIFVSIHKNHFLQKLFHCGTLLLVIISHGTLWINTVRFLIISGQDQKHKSGESNTHWYRTLFSLFGNNNIILHYVYLILVYYSFHTTIGNNDIKSILLYWNYMNIIQMFKNIVFNYIL